MGRRKTKPQLATAKWPLDLGLQDLVNSLEDELFIVDEEYRVKFANSSAMQKLGGQVVDPVERLCYEVFEARKSPCNSPLWLCPLNKVLQSGKATVIVQSLGNFPHE